MRASITADIGEVVPSPSPAARAASPPKLPKRSWLGRLMGRRPEPTLFHRCLAIHIAGATEWDPSRSGRSDK